MDLVTCCIVLCSVDSTFTDVSRVHLLMYYELELGCMYAFGLCISDTKILLYSQY